MQACSTVLVCRGGAQEDEWLAVVADAFEGERGRNFIGDREIMLRIGAEAAAA